MAYEAALAADENMLVNQTVDVDNERKMMAGQTAGLETEDICKAMNHDWLRIPAKVGVPLGLREPLKIDWVSMSVCD